jgi:predicted alpha/beta-fold hydrolase
MMRVNVGGHLGFMSQMVDANDERLKSVGLTPSWASKTLASFHKHVESQSE